MKEIGSILQFESLPMEKRSSVFIWQPMAGKADGLYSMLTLMFLTLLVKVCKRGHKRGITRWIFIG